MTSSTYINCIQITSFPSRKIFNWSKKIQTRFTRSITLSSKVDTFTKCQSFKYNKDPSLAPQSRSQWSTNSETVISILFWSVNSLVPQSATCKSPAGNDQLTTNHKTHKRVRIRGEVISYLNYGFPKMGREKVKIGFSVRWNPILTSPPIVHKPCKNHRLIWGHIFLHKLTVS